jgi:hypothetical protein
MNIPIPDPEPEDPGIKVIHDIIDERERQKRLAVADLDLTNTRNDYIAYVTAYIGRAADKCPRNDREGQEFRTNMLKAAALIVAALEAYDVGTLST